jgi:hypothetical protein
VHGWVVEQGFALLHLFRRLRPRYEIRIDTHEAFLSLACGIACLHRLPNTPLCQELLVSNPISGQEPACQHAFPASGGYACHESGQTSGTRANLGQRHPLIGERRTMPTMGERPFMAHFAEPASSIVDMTGVYDPMTQRWKRSNLPSMRTNYQTWQDTQLTTSTHTSNGDYVPDYPSDTQPDNGSD